MAGWLAILIESARACSGARYHYYFRVFAGKRWRSTVVRFFYLFISLSLSPSLSLPYHVACDARGDALKRKLVSKLLLFSLRVRVSECVCGGWSLMRRCLASVLRFFLFVSFSFIISYHFSSPLRSTFVVFNFIFCSLYQRAEHGTLDCSLRPLCSSVSRWMPSFLGRNVSRDARARSSLWCCRPIHRWTDTRRR